MNHEHSQRNACPYCSSKSNEPIFASGAKTKLTSFLGICGCVACYATMFPLALLGLLGVFGISIVGIAPTLAAYAASPWYGPIFFVSLTLIVVSAYTLGTAAFALSLVAAGIMVVGMTLYMKPWLFVVAFAFLTLAQVWGQYRRAGAWTTKKILASTWPFIAVTALLLLGIVAPLPQQGAPQSAAAHMTGMAPKAQEL